MERLADPTRLRLLRLLERHELGVAELVRRPAAPAVHGQPAPEGAGRPGLGARAAPQGTTNLYRMDVRARRGARAGSGSSRASRPRAGPPSRQDQLRLTRRLARAAARGAGLLRRRGRAVGPAARGALRPLVHTRRRCSRCCPRAGPWPTSAAAPGQAAAALAPHVRRVVGRGPVGGHAEGGARGARPRWTTSSCGRGASRRCRSTTRAATARCCCSR